MQKLALKLNLACGHAVNYHARARTRTRSAEIERIEGEIGAEAKRIGSGGEATS